MPLIESRAVPSYGAIETQDHTTMEDHEREGLLRDDYETEGEASSASSISEAQEGVRKIEAINMTWTARSLMVAYVRLVWLVASLP